MVARKSVRELFSWCVPSDISLVFSNLLDEFSVNHRNPSFQNDRIIFNEALNVGFQYDEFKTSNTLHISNLTRLEERLEFDNFGFSPVK